MYLSKAFFSEYEIETPWRETRKKSSQSQEDNISRVVLVWKTQQ